MVSVVLFPSCLSMHGPQNWKVRRHANHIRKLMKHEIFIYTIVFCAMIGIYSLTGSVSSSSGVVLPQSLVAMNYSLVHDAMT